ncbi:FixH [Rhodobacteraceae bacterium THAF1]|uniref:FixH family protein n=1 Tax=Palleronia sp. THAF1 TaxID=2587842 RepID=UPI000F3B06B4|nr:FixH family protein [Palleronia sp. THAF1]QFU08806.1 FixH [Palleronia sp. THAF1]VDC23941.1 FixH [Rhodobacteraceae bacterium THAF1]
MTELTGRRVAAIFVGGFGIIISVNLALAFNAVRSFPGLEVANSYVASQSFQDRRDAQEALGWRVDASYDGEQVHVAVLDASGDHAPAENLSVHIARPTEARDDQDLTLTDGSARLDLARGTWRLDIAATAPDGTAFAQAITLRVAP